MPALNRRSGHRGGIRLIRCLNAYDLFCTLLVALCQTSSLRCAPSLPATLALVDRYFGGIYDEVRAHKYWASPAGFNWTAELEAHLDAIRWHSRDGIDCRALAGGCIEHHGRKSFHQYPSGSTNAVRQKGSGCSAGGG